MTRMPVWGVAGTIVAGVGVVILGAAWAFQGALLYAPDTTDPGPAKKIDPSADDLSLRTSDSLEISAWRFDPPATTDPGRGTDPGPGTETAVLYLPGNGGNRAGRASLARAFTDRGLTAILLDYRGFGGNPGTPSEAGLRKDALAALDYLLGSGFLPENIYLVGESLGTAVAVQVATTQKVGGVLLRSPFTSMVDVAQRLVRVPLGWLIRDHHDSLARISSMHVPVTILVGGADDLVPPSQCETLARQTPNLHAYVEIPGAGHNDEIWFGSLLADRVIELAAR